MASKCAACPQFREQKRTASIHGKQAIAEGWGHPFADKRPLGIQAVSEGRRAYLEQSQYPERSKAARAEPCAFFAAGAPSVVGGFIACDGTAEGIHHIAPRGLFGGLEAAERYPTVSACHHHNSWCQQTAEGRAWARTHRFFDEQTGKEWPFLLAVTDEEARIN